MAAYLKTQSLRAFYLPDSVPFIRQKPAPFALKPRMIIPIWSSVSASYAEIISAGFITVKII
jgi:hypothetical protein